MITKPEWQYTPNIVNVYIKYKELIISDFMNDLLSKKLPVFWLLQATSRAVVTFGAGFMTYHAPVLSLIILLPNADVTLNVPCSTILVTVLNPLGDNLSDGAMKFPAALLTTTSGIP